LPAKNTPGALDDVNFQAELEPAARLVRAFGGASARAPPLGMQRVGRIGPYFQCRFRPDPPHRCISPASVCTWSGGRRWLPTPAAPSCDPMPMPPVPSGIVKSYGGRTPYRRSEPDAPRGLTLLGQLSRQLPGGCGCTGCGGALGLVPAVPVLVLVLVLPAASAAKQSSQYRACWCWCWCWCCQLPMPMPSTKCTELELLLSH
jgi:hypothetical protein